MRFGAEQTNMDARLERNLRTLMAIMACGACAGLAFAVPQGHSVLAGLGYGVLMSGTLGAIEVFVLSGAIRDWLSQFPFTIELAIRSAIYAVIIAVLQWFQAGEFIAGLHSHASVTEFWYGFVYSAAISVLFNLGFAITNLIGARSFLNFITGRYHTPVEENRFVLFVDIAGSTGLAERLGGVGIHRFLARTFRLLTDPVVDYRGEVLNYIGDEVIVTWPEESGAIDSRPLRCFAAMREALSRAAGQFESEFGAVPRIRGSLHYGPVIIGEIGEVKTAIVFNGDVMNTAARLEELSRKVDGGFLASRAAMARFNSAPPFAVCDLGRLEIRGRADGIDVVGIAAPVAAVA
jgi:adenylate cyclase